MPIDTAALVDAIRQMANAIISRKTELTRLDQAIGDGDHGENLARGFTAVLAKLDTAPPENPAAALQLVATTLISAVGGASGPLFGTAFLRAGKAVGAEPDFGGGTIAAALVAARDGVIARGKAEVGDKTMIDALAPATEAAQLAAAAGGAPGEVLAAAAAAARTGAESTLPLQARRGRASYLGERSKDHLDPGAMSTAYLLESLAASAARGPAD